MCEYLVLMLSALRRAYSRIKWFLFDARFAIAAFFSGVWGEVNRKRAVEELLKLAELVKQSRDVDALYGRAWEMLDIGGIDMPFELRQEDLTIEINREVSCNGLIAKILSNMYYLCAARSAFIRFIRITRDGIWVKYDDPHEPFAEDYVDLTPLKPHGLLFLYILERKTRFIELAMNMLRKDEEELRKNLGMLRELATLVNALGRGASTEPPE
mgnify:CR=1 FL=1